MDSVYDDAGDIDDSNIDLQRMIDIQKLLENLNPENIQSTVQTIIQSHYNSQPYDLMYHIFIVGLYNLRCCPHLSKLIKFLTSNENTPELKDLISHFEFIYNTIFKGKHIYFPLATELVKLQLLDPSYEVNPPQVSEAVQAIQKDDVSTIKNLMASNSINLSEPIPFIEPALRRYFQNTQNSGNNIPTIFQYAAYVGATECFRFLALHGGNMQTVSPFAIAGGHSEIIKICEESEDCSFHKLLPVAAFFRQFAVYDYLESKQQDISPSERIDSFLKALISHSAQILLKNDIIDECSPPDISLFFNGTICNGNHELLQYLFELYPINPDNIMNPYFDILKKAISLSQFQCLQALLQNIIFFNDDRYKITVFKDSVQSAIESNTIKSLELILSFFDSKIESKFDSKNTKGHHFIMEAYLNCSLDIVEVFLKHPKFPVNDLDDQGNAVIHYACEPSNFKLLKLLSEYQNVDLNVPNHSSLTPLLYSLHFEYVQAFLFLFNNKRVDKLCKDKNESTVLHFLSSVTNPTIIDAVFQTPEIIKTCNLQNRKKETPLFKAIVSNNNNIISRFLTLPDIDPNIPNVNEKTPLEAALDSNNEEIITKLINFNKTNLNLRVYNNLTLLQCLAKKRLIKPLKALLQHNININEVNDGKQTALHYAIGSSKECWKEGLEYLLNVDGIDVDPCDFHGITPLRMATTNKQIDAIKIILKYPNLRIGYAISAAYYDKEVLNLLLSYPGASVNDTDFFGNTILHNAVKKWYFNGVKYILDNSDIDINIRNNDGETAYDIAKKENNILISNLFEQYIAKKQ